MRNLEVQKFKNLKLNDEIQYKMESIKKNIYEMTKNRNVRN